jgi:hypothetical protein
MKRDLMDILAVAGVSKTFPGGTVGLQATDLGV